MNKKIIAIAIAAAVAAPAAFAETTLYGKAHVDIRNTDAGTDMWSVNSNASRLGVKGSEDLGDGLKAIFGYEMGYNITDGAPNTVAGQSATSQITARNAYVGLAGGFGTFLVGRHDTPAKVAFYATGNDLMGDSVADLNRVGFTELRLDNAIAYISPSFSGLTAAAAVVPGETAAADGLADAYSLAAMYSGYGLKASVAYEVAASGTTLGTSGAGGSLAIGALDHEMFQAGASYTMSNFLVGANYEYTTDEAGFLLDKETWAVTGKATFGNNFLMARYGESSKGAVDTDTIHLGAGHNMSKRTQVYVAYENQDAGAADSDAFSLGMVHSF